uniref:GPI transamidase component PIG-S n=1 Tax=Branchiostoma floridae TaxID=7739 RepID=C3XUL3_BRAFL|eukprot:XP_002612286.1 hypothetical protein BRAFLDRAFT_104876 [Branchiostoma floridae]
MAAPGEKQAAKSLQDEEEAVTQVYATLGVALVVVVIGVPLWWKTTEVYRASLPYADIGELKGTQVIYKVGVEFVLPVQTQPQDLLDWREQVDQHLDTGTVYSPISPHYDIKVRTTNKEERTVINQQGSMEDLEASLTQLKPPDVGSCTLYLLPKDSSLEAQAYIGRHRTAFVKSSGDVSRDVRISAHLVRSYFVNDERLKIAFTSATGAQHDKRRRYETASVRKILAKRHWVPPTVILTLLDGIEVLKTPQIVIWASITRTTKVNKNIPQLDAYVRHVAIVLNWTFHSPAAWLGIHIPTIAAFGACVRSAEGALEPKTNAAPVRMILCGLGLQSPAAWLINGPAYVLMAVCQLSKNNGLVIADTCTSHTPGLHAGCVRIDGLRKGRTTSQVHSRVR